MTPYINEIDEIAAIVLAMVSTLVLLLVLKRDLHMLQTNSYRNERYVRWINSSQETTSTQRLLCCIALFLMLVDKFPYFTRALIALALVAYVGFKLALKKNKKPLVFTKRAVRIFSTSVGLSAVICILTGIVFGSVSSIVVAALALCVLSPLVVLFANWILKPVEKHINNGFYKEAKGILSAMPALKVVGITGSYGKTSTKHYLYRILSEKYQVTMTPRSFNTTMGVIRTIREHLKPYDEVFIVEMGAKQPGDIREICELVKPQIGIVTSVGEQHLETFKTIENVQKTKFELIDSLPDNGLAVLNDDFEYIANRPVESVEARRYSSHANRDVYCKILIIEINSSGTEFELSVGQEKYKFKTRLVGSGNISNLAAAIITAIYMRVPMDKIRNAVEKIEQVEHRLNIKRTAGGFNIIDDAYNSNPIGSAMALDVLSRMNGGCRILVTPGMIELGEKQYELNRSFGEMFNGRCDIAIIVGEYNQAAILEGALAGGMDEGKIILAKTFNEAQAALMNMISENDTVLYENDLPDTFK